MNWDVIGNYLVRLVSTQAVMQPAVHGFKEAGQ